MMWYHISLLLIWTAFAASLFVMTCVWAWQDRKRRKRNEDIWMALRDAVTPKAHPKYARDVNPGGQMLNPDWQGRHQSEVDEINK